MSLTENSDQVFLPGGGGGGGGCNRTQNLRFGPYTTKEMKLNRIGG